PTGGTELCFLLGGSVDPGSAGAATVLSRKQLDALTEPDSIVVDESALRGLGLLGRPDGRVKINGRGGTLVGTVRGARGIAGGGGGSAGGGVCCSLWPARPLLGPLLPPGHVTYLLARCDSPAAARAVARDLTERYGGDMSAYTAGEFSTRTRRYWLARTKAGV